MKQNLFSLMTLALSISALTFVVSCGEDEEVVPNTQQIGKQNEQGDQQNGVDNQNDPTTPIIVTVDADGKADGGHHFVNIDGESFYIDDIKYTASQGSLFVTGYNNAFFDGDAKIISQLNYVGREMSVKGIDKRAFSYCTVLTSVIIPSSITGIEKGTFQGCTSLSSVTIAEGITNIEEGAFSGCTSLTDVTINSNSIVSKKYSVVFEFGGNKISNISSIFGSQVKRYILGNGVISIGDYAFYQCTELTSVTIPSSVTKIGNYSFQFCRALASVTIPTSVTSIGTCAFLGCRALSTVTIPSFVTNIGEFAFYGCTGLTSISVADGNSTYDSRDNCNAIIETQSNKLIAGCNNTIIPEGVTSIAKQACWGCTGLTSLTIPSSVTSIGESAFSNCTGLTDVFCYAMTVPSFSGSFFPFDYDSINNATLHVPASAIDAYKSTVPWSGFGSIVAIE